MSNPGLAASEPLLMREALPLNANAGCRVKYLLFLALAIGLSCTLIWSGDSKRHEDNPATDLAWAQPTMQSGLQRHMQPSKAFLPMQVPRARQAMPPVKAWRSTPPEKAEVAAESDATVPSSMTRRDAMATAAVLGLAGFLTEPAQANERFPGLDRMQDGVRRAAHNGNGFADKGGPGKDIPRKPTKKWLIPEAFGAATRATTKATSAGNGFQSLKDGTLKKGYR